MRIEVPTARKPPRLARVAILFALGCILYGPPPATHAQNSGEITVFNPGNAATLRAKKYSGVPNAELRDLLEQEDMKLEMREREIVHLESTPWTNELGELLVAVVGDRHLTQAEMKRRVDIQLQFAPPLTEPTLADDRRVLFESNIVGDWVRTQVLALHAERLGMTVSDVEIDAAIQKLAELNSADAAETQQRVQMIGIPAEVLRREVRDGLLVEKVVNQVMNQTFSEQVKRQIFQETLRKDRDYFLRPTEVRAWHFYLPQVRRATRSELKSTAREMLKLSKKMRKAESDADLENFEREIEAANKDYRVSDMGWVAEDSTLLPHNVKLVLFSLDVGDTSKVIPSDVGLHVVKVLERQDGDRGTFEEALPQIDALLHEETRETLYESLIGEFPIHRNAAGLRRYLRADETRAAAAGTPPAPIGQARPAAPDLSALRQLQDRTSSPTLGTMLDIEPGVTVIQRNPNSATPGASSNPPVSRIEYDVPGVPPVPPVSAPATTDPQGAPYPPAVEDALIRAAEERR